MTDEQLSGQDGTQDGQLPPEEKPGKGGASVLVSRRAMLLYAMVAIFIVAMLAGTADRGPLSRWMGGGLGDSEIAGSGDNGLGTGVPGGAERPEDDDATGDANGGAGGSAAGTGAGGGTTNGTGSGAGTPGGAGQAAERPEAPPADDSQPAPPADPVVFLEENFGESLFPGAFPGMEQVNVFDFDENEWSATYKDEGATDFDIVRITVQRGEAAADAAALLEEVRGLFTEDRIVYEWGGRGIGQGSDVPIDGSRDPAFNFSWSQGRYVIDVTVYPPYRSGVAAGRTAALEFIGRLEY